MREAHYFTTTIRSIHRATDPNPVVKTYKGFHKYSGEDVEFLVTVTREDSTETWMIDYWMNDEEVGDYVIGDYVIPNLKQFYLDCFDIEITEDNYHIWRRNAPVMKP